MNTEREIRNGYEISSQMKKVWMIEMQLLNKLLQVCDKHNLRIWADGGTLLGTVREHGFIPWDDDIDMCMMREDYDTLIKISKKEFESPYFFQSTYTDVDYPNGHAQLRMDNTTAISLGSIYGKYHQGIFIDIFVYDAIPESKTAIKKLRTISQRKLYYIQNYCNGIHLLDCIKHPILGALSIFENIHIKSVGLKQYFADYEDLFKENKIADNDKVGAIAFSFDRNIRHQLKKSYFCGTKYLPFEDIQMPVPSEYDKMLSSMYGDYMKPAHAPSRHGGFMVLDPQKDYKEYLPSLRKQYLKLRINSWLHK